MPLMNSFAPNENESGLATVVIVPRVAGSSSVIDASEMARSFAPLGDSAISLRFAKESDAGVAGQAPLANAYRSSRLSELVGKPNATSKAARSASYTSPLAICGADG